MNLTDQQMKGWLEDHLGTVIEKAHGIGVGLLIVAMIPGSDSSHFVLTNIDKSSVADALRLALEHWNAETLADEMIFVVKKETGH